MELLKTFRERYQFSQAELALFLGVDLPKVKKMEAGQHKLDPKHHEILSKAALYWYQTIDAKESYVDKDDSLATIKPGTHKTKSESYEKAAIKMRRSLSRMIEERKKLLFKRNSILRLASETEDMSKVRKASIDFLLEVIDGKLAKTNKRKQKEMQLKIDRALAISKVFKSHLKALKSTN